jgi:hypothetical protein
MTVLFNRFLLRSSNDNALTAAGDYALPYENIK